MYQTDESTIGGRIRKCRMATNQSIKDFAPHVGITSNYLSMVERGTKTPSATLLRNVADVANVSYSWLLNGEDSQVTTPMEQPSSAAVNPQLFLSLVLARSPDMTKETLAMLLMISPETLDGILTGDSVDFVPQWANIFPALAHRMDISAVRRELKTLDGFLAKEEVNAEREALLRALQRHVATLGQEYKISGPIADREMPLADCGEPRTVTASRMTLQNKLPPNNSWYFDFFPLPATVSGEDIREILLSHVRFADTLNPPDRLSIVLADRDMYNRFSDCAGDYKDRHDQQYEDPTCSSVSDAFPREMSLILVDVKTWEVLDEEELVDDD